MKILQISTGFDISFNGGITNYVRNISSTLQEYGNEVYVMYSQDNGKTKDYNYKLINIVPKLRPFHLGSCITNSDIKKIEKIVSELKPDIIHVHMMIDLPIEVLSIFKKKSKLIISLHDYSFLCNRITLLDRNQKLCIDNNENNKCSHCISIDEASNNRIIKGLSWRIRKMFNINGVVESSGHHERFVRGKQLFLEADALTAVSHRVKEIYNFNGYTNNNFFVNHIGNYTAEDEFKSKFGIRRKIEKGDKVRFGFIGNFSPFKGSDIVLRIAENCNHEFHIYGGTSEHTLSKIGELPNVFYHGRYNHNDLVNILGKVDIGLVLPVWEDNGPQVVFEFLNSGVPIIGTRMGGIPDFVNESNGKLYGIDEPEILRLVEFLKSDELFGFYNGVINNFPGTKKAKEHMDEILEIYSMITV